MLRPTTPFQGIELKGSRVRDIGVTQPERKGSLLITALEQEDNCHSQLACTAAPLKCPRFPWTVVAIVPGSKGEEAVYVSEYERVGFDEEPLKALRERDSVQAVARQHEQHPNQVSTWNRQLLDTAPEVFAGGGRRKLAELQCS